MVTDYDCWNRSHADVTVDQVLEVMSNNTRKVQTLLINFFNKLLELESWNWSNTIYNNLDNSIITDFKKVNKKNIKRLKPILERYLIKNGYVI